MKWKPQKNFRTSSGRSGEKMMNLWLEFESGETAEAKFAHTMDNIQPAMLNDATDGKAW